MKTNEIVLSSQIESTISFGFNISALQEQRTNAENRPKKGRLQNCRIFCVGPWKRAVIERKVWSEREMDE